jgi:hypothetical protein
MAIPITINFLYGPTQVGTTDGTIEDGDIPSEVANVADYFRGNSLAVKALNLPDWDQLVILVQGQSHSFSRQV